MLQITNKQDCCGCYACVQRCPKQCIRMESDEEGFEYPIIALIVVYATKYVPKQTLPTPNNQ